MDEIAVTFFLAGTEPTLPVYVWGLLRFGFTPEVNAAFTLIAGGSLLLIGIAGVLLFLSGRRNRLPEERAPGPLLARRADRPRARSRCPVRLCDPRSLSMQFAIFLPNFGPFGDTDALVELAARRRAGGWDGFFIWDHIQLDGADTGPIVDPWVALTAVAGATTNLRIGTMITPLARRRPWKLARETVTLDRVSGGRLTLGVGLGYPPEDEFGTFGEETDDRVRADEARRGPRDPRRPLERREARLRRRALPGLRRPVPAPARPGAADPDLVRRLVAEQTPVPARRALGRRRPRARPGGGTADPDQVARNRRLRQGARSQRPVRHRDQRLLGAGRRPRGGLHRRVRGRRPHLVARADRHRPTFLIRPSTTASPRWPSPTAVRTRSVQNEKGTP